MASPPVNDTIPYSQHETEIYKQLEGYDWAADTEFHVGLQAILGSTADPARAEHLTLRARCFYFSRKKNIRIDFNRYIAWRTSESPNHAVNGASRDSFETLTNKNLERRVSVAQQYSNVQNPVEPPAPYPTSFEQIVELISTGQPIPGVKDVPDTVLEGQASQTTATKRRKPWEKLDAGVVESDSVKGIQMNAKG